MNFDASLPVWSPEPRARVQVSFNHGKRYFYLERGKELRNAKFPMSKVLKRFLGEIKITERKVRIQSEKKEKALKARQNLSKLCKEMGALPTKNPDIVQKNSVKVTCLPQTPTQVSLTLTVTHDQVLEIIRKYTKV